MLKEAAANRFFSCQRLLWGRSFTHFQLVVLGIQKGEAMNRKILIRVAMPGVIVGLLLLGTCLVAAWYVNRLQSKLTEILASNVASIQAAQQLENHIRQLRFHCFLYLVKPEQELLGKIYEDEEEFEKWLVRAEEIAYTAEEQVAVQAIKESFTSYQTDLNRLRLEAAQTGPSKDPRTIFDAHPVHPVIAACREYARLNEELMLKTSDQSNEVSRWLRWTMLLLGLGGPLAGVLGGYGIARGLSRSLYQLSVRVQDMAQHLEHDVANLQLRPEADLDGLDSQLQYVVGRVAEVTEKLQRQQRDMLRAEQLAAVGQLAASVAHEVRNPLTSIKMLVEAGLRNHKPRPFTEENLRVVHSEIIRLEETVRGFLDFARPPALRKEDCDVRGVVTQATDLVRARARQQKVVLEVDCPEDPVIGHLDASQFRNVLVNLFINALDAMPGGGRLEVKLREMPCEGISLIVADTGEGISPEIIDQLFTPFASTKLTGSGLGLSICKRVVEEHGGAISAANRPQGGASFTVVLPSRKTRKNQGVQVATWASAWKSGEPGDD